jgi:L-arabinokinase
LRIVFYISGHGLGHASRDVELVKALRAHRRDVRVIVRTAAPAWVFADVRDVVDVEAFVADPGVAQIDSLHLDERETTQAAWRFYRDFDRKVDSEAALIRQRRPAIVLGDIPPLAFAAAARAGVPSIAIGNFTWDWIYAAYPEFEAAAAGVLGVIRDAYRAATRALRLPMHGGFEAMAGVTSDIPFIARQSDRDPSDTRGRLGITGDKPFVLASFGGYSLKLPYDEIARSERVTLVAYDREPPAGVKYPDVVAAADVVVSKPGYGIISDCLANNTALVYTSRGRFVEYDVLVAEMPRVLRCRYLPMDDLLAGRWADAISAVLEEPAPPEKPRLDGADVAANAILELVQAG